MILRVKRFLASYTLLLITLMLFLLQPLFHQEFVGGLVFSAALSLVVISAVMTMYENQRLHVILWVLATPAVLVQWLQHAGFDQHMGATLARELFSAIFLGFTSLAIIIHLLAAKNVTLDTLAGAMSAYLLMGITFAAFYGSLETWQPGSFAINDGLMTGESALTSARNFIYFSFITLTTTGFGDALPVTQAARSLTMIEAIFGQFYLGVLIAVLVGKHFTTTDYTA